MCRRKKYFLHHFVYFLLSFSAFVLATVLAAFDISGGMFNPMLATALLGGCKGHSHLQHIVVYWVGGFSGTFATSKVYPTIKKMVYSNAVEDQRDRKVKGDKKKVN